MTDHSSTTKVDALVDPEGTCDALASLQGDAVEAQERLVHAVALARVHGLSWDRIGEALGLTKQGASQWLKRSFGRDVGAVLLMDDAELARLGRTIGLRRRAIRYEVRRIISGRVGVNAVKRETVSRHLRVELAHEKAERTPGGEVWTIHPDGRQERTVTSTYGNAGARSTIDASDELTF